MSFRALPLLVVALAILASGDRAAAAAGQSVLVVVNGRHPASATVAERYRVLHAIPDDQVVSLDVEVVDQISRPAYVAGIEQPIAQWFERMAAHDRITYIVLMPGLPTRVAGTIGRTGTLASVDSELTLLYRTMTGVQPRLSGPTRNPYFTEAPIEGQWPAFDRQRLDTYLVARLDGFTLDDALALVGRCADASPGGRFVLDDRAPLNVREHRWFASAAERLTEAVGAERVVFDRTLSTVAGEDDVMGLYSWGSADPGNRQRRLPLTFRPGAIAASLASTDARTFVAPPDEWRPGSWQDRNTYYRGSPEWLVGDLVRSGLTGVAANVGDPYGDGAVRPDVLFPAYVAGRTLGEAMFLATPSLSWQTVVVGDPLCQPFGVGAREEPNAVPEFTTHEPSGLTQPFFDRRLAQALGRGGRAPRDAVASMLSAQAWLSREQRPAALAILADLAEQHPTYLPGLILRAQTLEAGGDGQAADAYRAVLAVAPDDVVALNNLAYMLIEQPGGATEALSLARRAYEVTKGAPLVADTFGWVLFRAGDTAQAVRVLRDAVGRQPALAELRVHLARALLAEGDLPAAKAQWDRALELDPAARKHAHAGPLGETFSPRPAGR